jgi:hypothetical protein
MADEIRKQENPSDSQYDKTDPTWSAGGSQAPNQGSRPGNPAKSDEDEAIREPNTDDDDEEAKRGGMGRDRDTDPGEPGIGGMGGTGGMGGSEDR